MNGQSPNIVTEKLTEVIGWFTEKYQTNRTIQSDSLYKEIDQLKETLATTPTKPTRIIRNKKELQEPVTEQQRLMDMAG